MPSILFISSNGGLGLGGAHFLLANSMLFFTVKFCCVIGFLILIRGGTPRYRYDFLTKLG